MSKLVNLSIEELNDLVNKLDSQPAELAHDQISACTQEKKHLLEAIQKHTLPDLAPRYLSMTLTRDKNKFVQRFVDESLSENELIYIIALHINNIKLGKNKLYELLNRQNSLTDNTSQASIEQSQYLERQIKNVKVLMRVLIPCGPINLQAEERNNIADIYINMIEQPESTPTPALSMQDIHTTHINPFYYRSYKNEDIPETPFGQMYNVFLNFLLSTGVFAAFLDCLARVGATLSIVEGTIYMVPGVCLKLLAKSLQFLDGASHQWLNILSFGTLQQLTSWLNTNADSYLSEGARIEGSLGLVYRLCTNDNVTIKQIREDLNNSFVVKIAKIMPATWLIPFLSFIPGVNALPLVQLGAYIGGFLPVRLAAKMGYLPMPKVVLEPIISITSSIVGIGLHMATAVPSLFNRNSNAVVEKAFDCVDEFASVVSEVAQAPVKMVTKPAEMLWICAPTKYEQEKINEVCSFFIANDGEGGGPSSQQQMAIRRNQQHPAMVNRPQEQANSAPKPG